MYTNHTNTQLKTTKEMGKAGGGGAERRHSEITPDKSHSFFIISDTEGGGGEGERE